MIIKKATRQGVKPLIGIYSESGCGKTMTALLLARGLVGPSGKIVMLDTESGRGSLYADVIPGGYDVMELRGSFSPNNYIEAIRAIEESDAGCLIIDSGSHEWEGINGVTDMATTISMNRAQKWNKEWDGVVQFGDWKEPKMSHSKFMLKLLQSPLPIIVCLRAKYKSQQTKGTKEMADAGMIEQRQIGKTVVVKDHFTSPIQDENFIFEMTAHFEILKDHSIVLTKCSHPMLRDCFPKDRTEPISIKHGELLAKWCSSGGSPTPKSEQPKTIATAKTLQWMLEQLKDIHAKMQIYAIDKGIIMPDQGLEDWPLSQVPTDKTSLAQLRKLIEAHQ